MSENGLQPHACHYCAVQSTVPDVMPYLAEGTGHIWAHPVCVQQLYQARRIEREQHENGDGV